MDVDKIPFGVDFRSYLDQEVGKCTVLLVVIGRNWMSAKNDKGQPRLQDSTDFVRIEIESALRRNIRIVPLLTQDIRMPSPDELPEALKELVFPNGTAIRSDPDFHKDMDRLIKGLSEYLQAHEEEKLQRVDVQDKRESKNGKHGLFKTNVIQQVRQQIRDLLVHTQQRWLGAFVGAAVGVVFEGIGYFFLGPAYSFGFSQVTFWGGIGGAITGAITRTNRRVVVYALVGSVLGFSIWALVDVADGGYFYISRALVFGTSIGAIFAAILGRSLKTRRLDMAERL
jgi:hypothetical protein